MEALKSGTRNNKEPSAPEGGFLFDLAIDGKPYHANPSIDSSVGKYEAALSGIHSRKKGYEETAAELKEHFGYRPSLFSRALIAFISRITLPLAEGSYNGKHLLNQPHKMKSAVGTPLVVFAVHGKKKTRSLLLASRLGIKTSINIVDIEKDFERRAKGKNIQAATATGGKLKKNKAAHPLSVISRVLGKLTRQIPGSVTGKERVKASIKEHSTKDKNRSDARRDGKEGIQHATAKIVGFQTAINESNPLVALLKIQSQSAFPIRIVPVVQASQHSIKEELPSSLTSVAVKLLPSNQIKRLLAFVHNFRTAKISCCHPIYVEEYLPQSIHDSSGKEIDLSEEAGELKSCILNKMTAQHRALSGPPCPRNKDVQQIVLSDPRLVSFMYEYSIKNGVVLQKARKEAQDYLKEIASDYNPLVSRIFCAVIDHVFARFIDGIEIDPSGISLISSADTKSRIVLVCSHKSYIDPLLIGYAIYRSGLMPPQQVAGENLSFFPVGWLLRHCGAFYIRRNFIGETLYREVFKAYVRYLLARNYTITLYIEGTRSRDGKISHPKLGFMKILKEALDTDVCKDILLVPVYLGYDKVPEEASHVREMSGGKKVAESLRGFAALYKAVNTKLGRAFVRFGKPVSMRRALETSTLKEVAEELCAILGSLTPLTGRICSSASLLALANPEADYESVFRGASFLLDRGKKAKGIPFVDNRASIKNALDWLVAEGYVNFEDRDGTGIYVSDETGRRFLFYNANVGISHFIEDSVVAVATAVLLSEGYKEQPGSIVHRKIKSIIESSGFLEFSLPDLTASVSKTRSFASVEQDTSKDNDHAALTRLVLSADKERTESMKFLIHLLREIFNKEFFFRDDASEPKDFCFENEVGIHAITGAFSNRIRSRRSWSEYLAAPYENACENSSQTLSLQTFDAHREHKPSSEVTYGLKPSQKIYLLSSLLIPFIEAYAISAGTLSRLEPGSWYSEDDFLCLCYRHGQESLKAGAIRRPESLSKTAFLTSAEKFAESDLIRIRYQKKEVSKRKFALYKCLDSDELRAIETILLEIAGAVYQLNKPGTDRTI